MSDGRRGPLAGLRIVEVGHMLAGPYCGMLLADLGADVLKVEPAGGDIARHIGPHRVGPHNTYFASLNRNKRSAVLDLASGEGRARLLSLVREAHGLVTNLRPSAIRKLGLNYPSLRDANPQIACLALTGYGLDGPFAERPAYDYVIQAMVGIMAMTGEPGGPPTKTGYSAVDNSAGIMGALALVAQIWSGRGGQVDVSMYDVMLSQMNYLASAYLNGGEEPKRFANGAHPYIVPAQVFATSDGYVSLFVSHDEFWRILACELGHPEWVADPRFATMKARSENRSEVVEAVGAVLRSETTATWTARLSALGVVVAGVATLPEALATEHVTFRDMLARIATPDGELRLVGSPIRIDGTPVRYARPPLLGEHGPSFSSEPAPPIVPPGRPLDRRALARAFSRIADGSVQIAPERGGPEPANAWRIGVTGAPGAGKSTLLTRLVQHRLAVLAEHGPVGHDHAAVIAIDPSSPRTQGAILGDRVRMDALATDPRVYVRSLATRGGRAGLAQNIAEFLAFADEAGFRDVFLETVGIGQAEHAVRMLVDSLVLVFHPESGDSVQAMKSGIMELADIYVVNKADLSGAARTAAELRAVLSITAAGAPWIPPVIEIHPGRPEGISALHDALVRHRRHLDRTEDRAKTQAARRRFRLEALITRRLDVVLDDLCAEGSGSDLAAAYRAAVSRLASHGAADVP